VLGLVGVVGDAFGFASALAGVVVDFAGVSSPLSDSLEELGEREIT
jgi:hypothetical protein